MDNNAIEVSGLVKRFGSRTAVDGISFSVPVGAVFGLLGPNGAGKTTTVRLLNGIVRSDGGSIQILGADPHREGAAVRSLSGVLTESPSLYERLTARDNLTFYGRMHGLPEAECAARVDEMLVIFDLADRAAEPVGGFSKGMKQRLALARALLHRPQILYLDEPTAGLDPEAAQQVNQLVEDLSHANGHTIILCTHNLHEAQRLCDRVAVMNQGQIIAQGSLEELNQRYLPGIRVEVDLLNEITEPSLQFLRGLPGVKRVASNQRTVNIQVDQKAQIPELVAGLVHKGNQIVRVDQREYSLEEIYFFLQQDGVK